MGRAKAKPIGTIAARPPTAAPRLLSARWRGRAGRQPTRRTVQRIEHQGFLLLLTAVTLAFAWVLYPFYGAALWAVVVAVLFAPVFPRLLQSMDGRPSLAAAVPRPHLLSLVILPPTMVSGLLAH